MTQKEVLEIVKESKLWVSLTPSEKQDAINHAMKITQLTITEEDIGTNIG